MHFTLMTVIGGILLLNEKILIKNSRRNYCCYWSVFIEIGARVRRLGLE